jgi:hypothetical protein
MSRYAELPDAIMTLVFGNFCGQRSGASQLMLMLPDIVCVCKRWADVIGRKCPKLWFGECCLLWRNRLGRGKSAELEATISSLSKRPMYFDSIFSWKEQYRNFWQVYNSLLMCCLVDLTDQRVFTVDVSICHAIFHNDWRSVVQKDLYRSEDDEAETLSIQAWNERVKNVEPDDGDYAVDLGLVQSGRELKDQKLDEILGFISTHHELFRRLRDEKHSFCVHVVCCDESDNTDDDTMLADTRAKALASHTHCGAVNQPCRHRSSTLWTAKKNGTDEKDTQLYCETWQDNKPIREQLGSGDPTHIFYKRNFYGILRRFAEKLTNQSRKEGNPWLVVRRDVPAMWVCGSRRNVDVGNLPTGEIDTGIAAAVKVGYESKHGSGPAPYCFRWMPPGALHTINANCPGCKTIIFIDRHICRDCKRKNDVVDVINCPTCAGRRDAAADGQYPWPWHDAELPSRPNKRQKRAVNSLSDFPNP